MLQSRFLQGGSPTLFFVVIFASLGALNFGLDTAAFGGIQAMSVFTHRFGSYQASTKTWGFDPYLSSLLNSTPFLGKLVGCLSCGPMMERYGRRLAMAFLAVISLVGVVLQISATTIAQYAVGRVITYIGTGFTIGVIPVYESECSPPELRGAISSTLQLWIGVGQLIASVVNNATQKMTTNSSWLIPTGLQLIVPVVILVGLPFIPESPRWLLSKGRRDEAIRSTQTLRSKNTPLQQIETELELLSMAEATHGKGTFRELFQGTNAIRTWIGIWVMFFQQATGQTFVGNYGTVFYTQQHITNPGPYLLGVIGTATSLVSSTIVALIVDKVGRRPMLIIGSFLTTVWLFVLGSVGTIKTPNASQKSLMVASLQLFGKSYGMSWAPLSYVLIGELPNGRLREKSILLTTSVSVIMTFLVTFTLPYLLNAPYANLGPKVGFVYGAFSFLSLVFAYFFVPEMKDRSLEEIDEMFENKVSLRKFRQYKSTGLGGKITAVEAAGIEHLPGIDSEKGSSVEVAEETMETKGNL